MTMNKQHTPGPWTVKSGVDQMCSPDTTVCSVSRTANDNRRWWIFSAAETHGDTEADARLIAAAPDLLAALEEIEGVCIGIVEGVNPDEFTQGQEVMAGALLGILSSAIAKARGQE